jgi:peptidoglycan/xylan/chitin deacetylase (PgdA/CDA1 family)
MRHRTLLAFLAGALFVALSVRGTGAEIITVASGPVSVPVAALTFDDGPHPYKTPELLDILDDLGVRATFFIVGVQAVRHPELLAEIVKRGHGVANHSWSHRNMPLLDAEEAFDEIAFCSQAIEAITGIRPRFFRPPGGNWNNRVIETAAGLGLVTILWNVNAYDTTAKSPSETALLVIRNSGPGSIILMHGGMDNTIAAIPMIVTGLRDKGLLFSTLGQMFRFVPEAKIPLRIACPARQEAQVRP